MLLLFDASPHTGMLVCKNKTKQNKTKQEFALRSAFRSEAASGIADQGGGGPCEWVEEKGTCEQGRIHAVETNRGVEGGGDSRVECTLTHVCVCVCA